MVKFNASLVAWVQLFEETFCFTSPNCQVQWNHLGTFL